MPFALRNPKTGEVDGYMGFPSPSLAHAVTVQAWLARMAAEEGEPLEFTEIVLVDSLWNVKSGDLAPKPKV